MLSTNKAGVMQRRGPLALCKIPHLRRLVFALEGDGLDFELWGVRGKVDAEMNEAAGGTDPRGGDAGFPVERDALFRIKVRLMASAVTDAASTANFAACSDREGGRA